MRRWLLMAMLLAICWPVVADQIHIGVLSHRGPDATFRNWGPTADYLSRVIPEHHFVIEPLDFSEMEPAVRDRRIEFLLTNPGIYVDMEVRYRISRIATLNNLQDGQALNLFGGVIFTRHDRKDIERVKDLRGHSFIAVDDISLGGFQMARLELAKVGIDPHSDLSRLEFGGTHDAVVMAVLSGKVDAGTVRTGILEAMVQSGVIGWDEVKVLGEKHHEGFPGPHSTDLYPEWPFSKLLHVDNKLAQRVAVALLQMTELEPEAQWGEYAGWTVPLEYQPVHDLLRQLKLAPYDKAYEFTIEEALNKYWYWAVAVLAFLAALLLLFIWVQWLNAGLKKSKSRLEQQYALILDSVSDGIYGVDMAGKSTFLNKSMERMTGWRSFELVGARQHELLHHTKADGSAYPARDCPIFRTFAENKARFVEDDLFWRKDGSSFAVEYTSTPIHNERGNAVGAVVVFRDISERKRVQDEARQYQQELAHVARLSTMGEMASGLAHELNQPLTAIATSADACIRLLESGKAENDRLYDVLERIGKQARRAGEIITRLREFVRKDQPQLTLVDVDELIEEVLLLMRPEILHAGVQVQTDLCGCGVQVLAQRIQIDQVILNLTKNAVEAMTSVPESQRQLLISTRRGDDNRLYVSVADRGPGLDDAIRSRLFTPFATTKPQGMGLGLSISQGIIEAHGGRLSCNQQAAFGAVFSFWLPTASTGDE